MIRKKVLVAPLEWGLGHATRCIPIIEALLKRNCEVVIATSGTALKLLQHEFPTLRTVSLPSYDVRYSRSTPLLISVLLQGSKIRKAIVEERKRVKGIIKELKIDLLISDNRYGCWSEKIPSIFIGHILNIQLPFLLKWSEPIVNFIHRQRIKKFTECWVPDRPGSNLTGKLSEVKFPTRFIGILSRFKKLETEIKYDLAVILSGPEPQRSLLEEILLKQLNSQNLRTFFVRGVIESEVTRKQEGPVTIVNYLLSLELEKIINQTKLVVARSGYSTIMDLAVLGKKAVFIPTPGQIEQEYLAKHLMNKGISYTLNQKNFDLTKALSESVGFSGFTNIEIENDLLSKALDAILK